MVYIDLQLLDNAEKPFIVLKAKSEDQNPLVGKKQVRAYSKTQFVRYVIPPIE